MANQWYYERDGDKRGPVSADQLKDLAATGHIRRSDTIWKEGIQRGVLAAKVKHLFQPATAGPALETSPARTRSVSPDEQSDAGPPAEDLRPLVDSASTQPASPDASTVLEPGSEGPAAGPGSVQEDPTRLASAEPKPSEGRNQALQSDAETSASPARNDGPGTESPTALAAEQPNLRRFQPRKARATAVTGAVILRVEDTAVVYRKKCGVCGHEDASQSRIPIRNGVTRLSFFCPKCRKARLVQIQGIA
jgi:hypothetical protein